MLEYKGLQELLDKHDDSEVFLTWGDVKRLIQLRKKTEGSEPSGYEIFKSTPTALVDAMNNGYLPKKTRIYRGYLVMGPGEPFHKTEDWFTCDADVDEYFRLSTYAQFAGTGSILSTRRLIELEAEATGAGAADAAASEATQNEEQ